MHLCSFVPLCTNQTPLFPTFPNQGKCSFRTGISSLLLPIRRTFVSELGTGSPWVSVTETNALITAKQRRKCCSSLDVGFRFSCPDKAPGFNGTEQGRVPHTSPHQEKLHSAPLLLVPVSVRDWIKWWRKVDLFCSAKTPKSGNNSNSQAWIFSEKHLQASFWSSKDFSLFLLFFPPFFLYYGEIFNK